MDSGFIHTLQNLWSTWGIRGFVILSLCMQLVLALAAPFRKKTSNGFVISLVWSTYFLADWAAIFAFGLISNAGCRNLSNLAVAEDVMAFWAAFLLIHLGGPDTITAFSLEDNALWLRHLIGLIAQLFAFLYIFVKTLPHNRLLVPTILIFVAGVIKYGERTRALYLASSENLKKSIKKVPYSDIHHYEEDEADFPAEQRLVYHFFKIFRGLVVDIMPNQVERQQSREFFLSKEADETFLVMSSELNFLYEVFYTKIMAVNSLWGALTRGLTYYLVLVALILFCLTKKEEFQGVDVAITYSLLAVVFVLDIASGVMATISDWTHANDSLGVLIVVQLFIPTLAGLVFYKGTMLLSQALGIRHLIERLWSEKMGSFNLLSYCLEECHPRACRNPGFIWKTLTEMRHTSKKSFDPELWKCVFKELQEKALFADDAEKIREIYEARGDRTLLKSNCNDLMHYIKDFEYDKTLILWHIATEICYNTDGDLDANDDMKKFSRILSNYMQYLMLKRPQLMSPIAGIGHVRYEETCAEAQQLGRRFGVQTLQEFCSLILQENSSVTEPTVQVRHHFYSVLYDSCQLVRLLRGDEKRWEIICKVWVELLSYAASHSKADSHARVLSTGGEFITFVWLAMAHFGIDSYFPLE